MKWPFVARSQYELLQRWKQEDRAYYEAHLLRMQEQIDHLTKQLSEATIVGQPSSAPQIGLEAPDEFLPLIDAKCGSDYRKRAIMLRQLAADRAAKVSDEDIRAAIEYGVGPSGVPE